MASRLNPYLNFAGTATEALRFYSSVFGGTPSLYTFGQAGMPGVDPDQLMHGMLETPSGFTLMCSDTPEGMDRTVGTNIVVSLSGDDGDELWGYWEALSSGGTVTMPLEKQLWGDEFGMCTDRYGVPWMVNIAQAG